MTMETANGQAGVLGKQRRGSPVGQDLRGRAVAAVLERGCVSKLPWSRSGMQSPTPGDRGQPVATAQVGVDSDRGRGIVLRVATALSGLWLNSAIEAGRRPSAHVHV